MTEDAPARVYSKRKQTFYSRFIELLSNHDKVLLVGADNVGSSQMQQIRKSLRPTGATVILGKNTIMRRAIRDQNSQGKLMNMQCILPKLVSNVGFVMVPESASLGDIRTQILEQKINKQAKAGAISPCEVIVEAGPTGMEPTKTSFFQALNIPTKINKGQIEIINNVTLLTEGEKVGPSEAVLLQNLGLKPFKYGLSVKYVFENGTIYDAKVLDITDEDVVKKFNNGVATIAALSLAIGFPTEASVPHSLRNGYKNLMHIGLACENYSFKEIDDLKALLSDPEALKKAQEQAAAQTTGGDNGSGDKPAEEEEEEEEEFGLGGLF